MYYILEVQLKDHNKDIFFEMLWAFSEKSGGLLQGVFEGDAFTHIPFECDSDLPPASRDWVGDAKETCSHLYFETHANALIFYHFISKNFPEIKLSPPLEKIEEDWNKKWKEGFKGVSLPPFFYIYPPWEELSKENKNSHHHCLKINPGSGFGTGTHETTQMCLEVIGKEELGKNRFLDFGCGSGILSIGCALMGGVGDAIDIDPLALQNAKENCEMNFCENKIQLLQYLPSLQVSHPYDGIIANILKHVLLENADVLVSRLKSGGWVLLSGLLEQDLEFVRPCYEKLLNRKATSIISKNEWRALYWENA